MECRKKTALHFFLVQKNCSPESQDKGVLPEGWCVLEKDLSQMLANSLFLWYHT